MASFLIKVGASVWWPVHVNVPADGGTVETVTFDIKFRRYGLAQGATFSGMTDAEFITAVAIDWRGVVDHDSAPLAYTPTNVAKVLDVPGCAEAIGAAFRSCFHAAPETRLGNSEPSPAGGPAAAPAPASEAPPATPI